MNLTKFLTEQKVEIPDTLAELFNYIHDIEDVEDALSALNHIDDNGFVHEIIDGMIDIYYSDLDKWVSGNSHYIEEAHEEGLCDGSDFHKSIQCGQYVKYNQEVWNDINEVIKEVGAL